MKDDTGPPWDSSGSILAPTLRDAVEKPPTGTPVRQLRCKHLALLLGVHDRSFQLSLGAADPLASKLLYSSKMHRFSFLEDVVGDVFFLEGDWGRKMKWLDFKI